MNMWYKRILLFGFLFKVFSCNCQVLKTYSGDYSGGIATYQYYENNDYERIFAGKFSYKSTNDYPAAYYNYGRVYEVINITGHFKENLKQGEWIGKIEYTSDIANLTSVKPFAMKTLNGFFKDGNKEGLWHLKEQKYTNNKVSGEYNVTLNFNKNTIIGSVDFGRIKGVLDSNGNFIGKWVVNDKEGKEFIAEFDNNIFKKLIVRNISDGKIIFKYKLEDFFKNNSDSNTVKNNLMEIPLSKLNEYGTEITIQKISESNGENNGEEEKDSDGNDDTDLESNKYFFQFFDIIKDKIAEFDQSIYKISLGSNNVNINPPSVLIFTSYVPSNEK